MHFRQLTRATSAAFSAVEPRTAYRTIKIHPPKPVLLKAEGKSGSHDDAILHPPPRPSFLQFLFCSSASFVEVRNMVSLRTSSSPSLFDPSCGASAARLDAPHAHTSRFPSASAAAAGPAAAELIIDELIAIIDIVDDPPRFMSCLLF